MTETTQAEYLIARFGGINPMARVLGLTASVVQGWKERGIVPSRRHPAILEAGRTLDPPLSHREFFEQPTGHPHRMRREQAA